MSTSPLRAGKDYKKTVLSSVKTYSKTVKKTMYGKGSLRSGKKRLSSKGKRRLFKI